MCGCKIGKAMGLKLKAGKLGIPRLIAAGAGVVAGRAVNKILNANKETVSLNPILVGIGKVVVGAVVATKAKSQTLKDIGLGFAGAGALDIAEKYFGGDAASPNFAALGGTGWNYTRYGLNGYRSMEENHMVAGAAQQYADATDTAVAGNFM